MRAAYFLFGTSFFTLATSATLLMTWTCWWIAAIGPSMPARRPFFKPSRGIPSLLLDVTSEQDNDPNLRVYVYTLQGGWPTFNSIMRLLASLLAVIASFSFALLATYLSHVFARRLFSSVLFAVVWLALGSTVLDAVAIGRTGTECARSRCLTAVPDVVRNSENICICSVEGWFYATLLADVVLASASLICFILLVRPTLAAAVATRLPARSHMSLSPAHSQELEL